ncbi:hypothetical protein GSI_06058 [Ganoderma sinense ZZ0214-1]|uniref:Prolyl 4-hydroxylase alpha subunit Fe(2+) 2OG dioxygenase domain-containing protein n=1 Tax=Ganoderma sinense ZZ0214-1 TaxID=1077348 RepID=A0A2G8SC76_9APHY|nr:hypothetical protein GSI_06058 [Ganoderma sinense ZZ0214-1]
MSRSDDPDYVFEDLFFCIAFKLAAKEMTHAYRVNVIAALSDDDATHRSTPHSVDETLDKDGVDGCSEGEDDDDDEISRISIPGNIRDDLATIFEGDLDFNGEFSFHRAYPLAPNPSLNVDDLGTIGLPLSLRDAAAIKHSSDQAPFGKADRTIIDKSVRDTWEIDAQQVQFENPAWQPFLDGTVRDVCQALGVNLDTSKPRCELYKLLLYETGSHFLPHIDTEKTDGMFATMVIVLPSRFTGGAVCVSHGDTSKVYNHCENSLNETTVLAWYTDVKHSVKQITSGYRLALSFNLIHTTSSLRPAAPECSVPADLQRILLSWNDAEDHEGAPKKIVRLLDHKYSEATLGRSGSQALKGPDAHLLALLQDIAAPLGFQIGLANLHFTQRGHGSGEPPRSSRNKGWPASRWGYSRWDDDPEPDDSNVQMTNVESEVVEVKNLVDLDGDSIRRSLEYSPEEIIPDGLIETITSGDYDEQEYEGYMGNYGGSLERYYRRTVLVLWPKWAHFDLVHGSEAFSFACEELRASTSQEATEDEVELVEIILARSTASKAKDVVSSVCRVALTWKDFSLWFRAVRACDAEKSIGALQVDNILRAVATFGFDEVQPCIERTIERDPSNSRVLKFLERFEEWVANQESEELTALTASWSEIVRENRLDDLKSVAHDSPDLLFAAVLKHRGVEFFEQTVLPLVRQCSDCMLLLTHAVTLYDADGVPVEWRTRMAKDILRECLSKIDFYPTIRHKRRSHHRPMYGQEPSDESQQLEKAKPYLRACIALDCAEFFPIAVQKLLALDDLAEDLIYRRVKHVVLPLVAYVGEIARSRPGSQQVPGLRNLCEEAVSLFLQYFATKPQTLTKADVSSLIKIAMDSGYRDLVLTGIAPKLETLTLKDTQLREIVEELHAKRIDVDPAGTDLNPALLRLLGDWISTTSLTIPAQLTHHAYGTPSVNRVKPVIDVLDFCLKVSLPEACDVILERLLNPPVLDVEYIKTQLAPLFPDLRALVLQYKQPLTSPVFASAFRTVMLYWTQKQCSCDVCPAVRQFLTSEAAEDKEWHRIGAVKRGHVEKFLQAHARAVATYSTIRTVPHGLKVTKLPAIVAPARWIEHQRQGFDLLKSISADPAEIQAILGQKHAEISGLLQGRGPVEVARPDGGAAIPSSGFVAPADLHPFSARHVSAVTTETSNRFEQISAADTSHGNRERGAQSGRESTTSRLDTSRPAKRRRTTYDEKDVIDLT